VRQKGEQRVTGEIAHMLVILAIAIILFITEWLRVDVVALLVLLSLIVTGLITPEEAFSGFSSPAVLTVWAVFIVSGGLFTQVWPICWAAACSRLPVPVPDAWWDC
jgi:hypothetical protein